MKGWSWALLVLCAAVGLVASLATAQSISALTAETSVKIVADSVFDGFWCERDFFWPPRPRFKSNLALYFGRSVDSEYLWADGTAFFVENRLLSVASLTGRIVSKTAGPRKSYWLALNFMRMSPPPANWIEEHKRGWRPNAFKYGGPLTPEALQQFRLYDTVEGVAIGEGDLSGHTLRIALANGERVAVGRGATRRNGDLGIFGSFIVTNPFLPGVVTKTTLFASLLNKPVPGVVVACANASASDPIFSSISADDLISLPGYASLRPKAMLSVTLPSSDLILLANASTGSSAPVTFVSSFGSLLPAMQHPPRGMPLLEFDRAINCTNVINIHSWRFFRSFFGSLWNKSNNAILPLYQASTAAQVGTGANGRNIRTGLSADFKLQLLPTVGRNDSYRMRVDFSCGSQAPTAAPVSFRRPSPSPPPSPSFIPSAPLQPILECIIQLGPNDFVASWGYFSNVCIPLTLQFSRKNAMLSPDLTASLDRDQPNVFLPGLYQSVFYNRFGPNMLTWVLEHDGVRSEASACPLSSPQCKIDPCSVENGFCDELTICNKTATGRTCGPCPCGYEGDGYSGCIAPNFCSVNNGGCDPLTECSSRLGYRDCGECPSGYSGDGFIGCTDIDECATGEAQCDPVTACINEVGSWHCSPCPSGYTGTGETGCNLGNCSINNGGCDNLTQCYSLPTVPGTFCTACPSGFTGVGRTGCVDVDECIDPNSCGMGSVCINTVGSFNCQCGDGWLSRVLPDGTTRCDDVDECTQRRCGPNRFCNNTYGSYTCGECYAGYDLVGGECVDVDECKLGISNCPELMRCLNTNGSFLCAPCPIGFTERAGQCFDVDECTNSSTCPGRECINLPGSFECGECHEGYEQDGISCVDVDECARAAANNSLLCDSLTSCINTNGSYYCTSCPTGYKNETDQETGFVRCVDIDECATFPCDLRTNCTNVPGSFSCSDCPPPLLGNGQTGCSAPCSVHSCANGSTCDIDTNGIPFCRCSSDLVALDSTHCVDPTLFICGYSTSSFASDSPVSAIRVRVVAFSKMGDGEYMFDAPSQVSVTQVSEAAVELLSSNGWEAHQASCLIFTSRSLVSSASPLESVTVRCQLLSAPDNSIIEFSRPFTGFSLISVDEAWGALSSKLPEHTAWQSGSGDGSGHLKLGNTLSFSGYVDDCTGCPSSLAKNSQGWCS